MLEHSPSLRIHAVTCFLVQEGRVLLQERPREKLWGGMLNGPGGKIEAGETSHEAIFREVVEETALQLDGFEARGAIELLLSAPKPMVLKVDIFLANSFSGEPVAREGQLAWYERDNLPFERMWPDQRYWLPAVLDGYSVAAKVQYTTESLVVSKMDIQIR